MLSKLLINSVMINWDKIDESSYLRDIPALSGIDRISFTHPVTFFVGENGSGKSTLLEAIAVSCGFNPEGGTRNYNFSTYDSHSELCKAVRLSRGVRRAEGGYFLRAESFYNVATKEEEYSRGPGKISRREFPGPCAEQFQTKRTLYFGRAGSGPFTAEAADAAYGDRPLRQGGFAIHYCIAFADPAGASRRSDPEF